MSTATLHTEKKKILVPKLRFQEFEGEFVYRKLGDVCNIIMGQSPDSKSYNENGEGYYLIQGNADIKNRVSSPRQWTSMPTKICEIGDIILTVRAPVGAIAKSNHNACIGRGVCVIRNLVNYDLEYIYQFLLNFETKWGKLEQGSTFTAVSGADIKSIKSAFPTLPEQQKIASFLIAVDEKIQQISRKKELLEKYKKGVMQQLFSGKLRFKDENEKDYSDWENKKLGDLVIIKSGNSPSDYNLVNEGINPFIKVDELNNCSKYQNKSRFYSNDDKNIVEAKSVIFPKRGAAILNNKVRINDCPILMDSNMMALIPLRNELDVEFLYFKIVMAELYKIADTSSIPQINNKHIEPYIISTPCLEEQQKIAAFLSSIDTKIESTSQQMNQTQSFKKGLLQQLFV